MLSTFAAAPDNLSRNPAWDTPEKASRHTAEIKNFLIDERPITKAAFSCAAEPAFMSALKKSMKKQVIVIGIETHVCVYQTVADLLAKQYNVHVVADAVSSRTQKNKDIAIERMKTEGAVITSTEMIATELLRTSAHPKFKEILSLIR